MKTFSKLFFVVIITIIATLFITRELGEKSVKSKEESIKRLKLSLIKADEDFYNLSLIKGTGRAFIEFADSDVVLMRQNKLPIIGKNALEDSYRDDDTVKTLLKWNPVKAEVSSDGNLGYTFGIWKYETVDKTGKSISSYGNYITIWRKQKDGSWKYVFDGGSNTPSPKTLKD